VIRSRRPESRACAGAPGTWEGVDALLAFSSRRALALLAAGTIGLFTALLGVTGVAQATTFAGPGAAADLDVTGEDGRLDVYFSPAAGLEAGNHTLVASGVDGGAIAKATAPDGPPPLKER
jgi:hypothetical protein